VQTGPWDKFLGNTLSKNPNNPLGLSRKEIFWIFAIYFFLYSMLATLGFLGVEFFSAHRA
jgi:hypothetical protein